MSQCCSHEPGSGITGPVVPFVTSQEELPACFSSYSEPVWISFLKCLPVKLRVDKLDEEAADEDSERCTVTSSPVEFVRPNCLFLAVFLILDSRTCRMYQVALRNLKCDFTPSLTLHEVHVFTRMSIRRTSGLIFGGRQPNVSADSRLSP